MEIFKKRKELASTVIAYQKVFSTEEGKRVLADLLGVCGFMDSCMDPNPTEVSFKLGKREVVLRILNNINADPEKILEILRDNRKE